MRSMANSIYHEVVPQQRQEELHFSVAQLPEARGDPALLRQVWSNLIGNAVKFTSTKEAPRIDVSGHSDGGVTVYTVKDNGVGFDPGYAHKLFGVFQRLHRADEFEGTGVGLAIVQRIVQRHGGRAWAEGKVGEGAVFHFSLPNEEVEDARP
jgi:light-regulated signal transduction histidine kinase (bacteriophytochrome)